MISRQLQIWLAAEASGDLPPEQSRRIRAYLKRDAEAAAYFASLLADRRRLLRSPRRGAGEDLAQAVIAASSPHSGPIVRLPQSRPTVRRRAVFSAGIAVAAAVLTAVLLFPRPDTHRPAEVTAEPPPMVAAVPRETATPVESTRPTVSEDDDEPARVDPSGRSETPEPSPTADSLPAARVDVVVADWQRVPPAVPQRREPLTVDARDLSDAESGRKILTELRRGGDHALELSAKDTSRTLEELARLLCARGIAVLVDSQVVGPRARQRQVYSVYTEALYARDVLDLMRRLGQCPSGDNLAEPVFVQLSVARVSDETRQGMVALLGQDPFRPNPAPRRPGEERMTTADAGLKTKLSGGRPVAPPAFVGPVTTRPAGKGPSREAQQFLERKPEAPPGKLRVCITIRPV
jgi:hypothetical protein